MDIEIENVGPVGRLRIPLPENGGIVVLKGRNGAGKTQSLRAADALVNGGGSLQVRRGELRGRVEGCGVRLSVARSTRRSGELEVCGLEDRLDVGSLVDPGIADPEAADARRIRALVQVSGSTPDPALFRPLAESDAEWAEVAPDLDDAKAAADMLALAKTVKRGFEGLARAVGTAAETAERRAAALLESAAGTDVSADDSSDLMAALADATQTVGRLKAEREAATRAAAARIEAERQIAELEKAGVSQEDAAAAATLAAGKVKFAAAGVAEYRELLASAERGEQRAREEAAEAEARLREAVERSEAIGLLRSVLAAPAEAPPTAEDVVRAEAEAGRIAADISARALREKARESRRKAAEHAAEAEVSRAAEKRLRAAAAGTDDVLSKLIDSMGCPIRVEDGRLIVRRGDAKVYFSELSHGERWRLALDVAIDAVGEHGLLVIEQEAWEGLDPLNRDAIAAHVQARKAVVLTAEASGDAEVRVEQYAGAK